MRLVHGPTAPHDLKSPTSLLRLRRSRPRLLLIDELSMGLAHQIAESLLATLRTEAVRRDVGVVVVVVVGQHIPLALRFVDRGWVLSHGELSRDSTTLELANDPGFVSATYLGDH